LNPSTPKKPNLPVLEEPEAVLDSPRVLLDEKIVIYTP